MKGVNSMKRKIIALISVLALSFSVFAFSVSAVEGEESGGEIIETDICSRAGTDI